MLTIGFLILAAFYGIELTEAFVGMYILWKILCVWLVLLIFSLGTFMWNKTPTIKSSISTLVVCALLVIYGFSIEFIPTGPRKRFYVLANKIKSGDSVERALAILKDYKTSLGTDYVSSSFTPELGTTDRVGFGFDPRTRKIVDGPNYSPD
jgi:hypothetical protein